MTIAWRKSTISCAMSVVEHLADVVMRRTTLAVTGSLTRRDLHAIAPVIAKARGWSSERTDAELEATVTQLEARNLMRL